MGDIRPGQMVFDETGTRCTVTRVFEIETPQQAWRVHFSDGTHIDAGADHEWVTWTHTDRKAYLRSEHEDPRTMPSDWPKWRAKSRKGYANYIPREVAEEAIALHSMGLSIRSIADKLGRARNALTPHIQAGHYIEIPPPVVLDGAPGPSVKTTAEIAKTVTQGKRGDLNHCIPVAGSLQLPDAPLPVDPYVLGYWLGDGSKSSGVIAAHPEDWANLFEHFAAYEPHALAAAYTVGTYGLTTDLRKAGVLNDKHVPLPYLRASAAQRLAILQGLMDSDGHAASSSAEFCNTNKALVDGVVELARSLGQKPTVHASRATYQGKDCGPKWRVVWKPTIDVFRLERKRSAVKMDSAQGFRNLHRMITAVEPIEPVPMRCIAVDSPNHMYLAGEGMIPTHNSRCAAEWILREAQAHPNTEWGVIGPTSNDVRKCAEDQTSGIYALASKDVIPKYNRTYGDLYLANGAVIHLVSADKPDRLRGFNLAGAWCDELASWRYPDTWDLGLLPTMRDPRTQPHIVVTSTPKPVQLLRRLVDEESSERGTTVVTRGSTFDNVDNLAPQFISEMKSRYEGTRRGRQELYGELLTDVDGALVTQDMIDVARRREEDIAHLRLVRTVVAVDPATTSGEDSDETGIVVVARGADGRGYVLADLSCKESPDGWARIVAAAYERFSADRVIAEKNQGGDMVETIVRSVHPNISYKSVSAKIGKKLRAEPIAALYEQGKVSHVGVFEKLEDQWTTWVPDLKGVKSPDRVDALVHGMTELGLVGLTTAHFKEWVESEHPPCVTCGTPAPKGTSNCPGCGCSLDGDGTQGPSAEQRPWSPWAYGPSTLAPNPHTQAVMEMLRQQRTTNQNLAPFILRGPHAR